MWAGPGEFALGLLRAFDIVLRYANGGGVEPNHFSGHVDELHGMEAPTVVIEVGEEFVGSDRVVEGHGVLKILVPYLIDNGLEEGLDSVLCGCE